jgi:hypothetical protein
MILWDSIFGTDWFKDRMKEKAASVGFAATAATISTPYTRPQDGNRWGAGRTG